MYKSPFLLINNFLSPKVCEEITSSIKLIYPDTDSNNKPIKTTKTHQKSEQIIYERFELIHEQVGKHFNTICDEFTEVQFELFAQGYESEYAKCDNSQRINGTWKKTQDYDLSCVVFLSDYNSQPDFDDDYEVYGGKYEFPTHRFGLNPTRGMLLVYPSGPNFINGISSVLVGNCLQARFFIKTDQPFQYNPREFPGDYKKWFNVS